MALSAPVTLHRIHGVVNGGMFGGPSWSSLAGASHATAHEASTFSAVPNTTRGRANLSILAARTAAPSAPHSLQPPPTPVVTRPRRSSMRSLSAPVSIAARALSEDPFADVHAVSHQEFTIDALPPHSTPFLSSLFRSQTTAKPSASFRGGSVLPFSCCP